MAYTIAPLGGNCPTNRNGRGSRRLFPRGEHESPHPLHKWKPGNPIVNSIIDRQQKAARRDAAIMQSGEINPILGSDKVGTMLELYNLLVEIIALFR
jgi:hypothetical protein